MVSENEFKQNRNTAYLAALILDDFIARKFNGLYNHLSVKSDLLSNGNYVIDLNDFKKYRPNYGLGSMTVNSVLDSKEPDILDFTDFNKDLFLKAIAKDFLMRMDFS